jgi:hypothetical protein
MKTNGIIELLISATDQEIRTMLVGEDFEQVFIGCSNFAQRETVVDIYKRVKRLLRERNIKRCEPIVVSIVSVPTEERNKVFEFLSKLGIPVVSLTFERYIAAAE